VAHHTKHHPSPIIHPTDHGRPNINPSSFRIRGTLTGHRDIGAISPVDRIESIVFSMPLLPKHDVVFLANVQVIVWQQEKVHRR
jgi:hypothetical protein